MMSKLVLSAMPVLLLVPAGAMARGQSVEAPLTNPVIVSTSVVPGWIIEMIVDARSATTRVSYDSGRSEKISISVEDCARLADAMEAAADAVESGRPFPNRAMGDLTVLVGPINSYETGEDGRIVKRTRQGITLHAIAKGLVAPKPMDFDYRPVQAVEFARGMRLAPKIAARLRSAIDLDALRKAN